MKRIIFILLRMFYIAPFYIMGISRLSKKGKSLEESYAYIKKVAKAAIRAGRVEVETHGVENLPKEDGFMLYPNHQGMFDVLVFLQSCPRPFAYVIKKEAANLILLKQVGAALGSYSMDREDVRQSMQVINAVAEEVKNGKNFLLFAEGTRSKKGNELLEFKGGSFKIATKAKCPIVPCALIDSFKPFDESSIDKMTVQLIYLEPMYYEEYKDMKTQEIAAEVKSRIEAEIKKRLEEKHN